jgi:hypothetical protein
MSTQDYLPKAHIITEEDMQKYRDSGNYCPILFEWYKLLYIVAQKLVHIMFTEPGQALS